jgi:hypothetical protein
MNKYYVAFRSKSTWGTTNLSLQFDTIEAATAKHKHILSGGYYATAPITVPYKDDKNELEGEVKRIANSMFSENKYVTPSNPY